MGRLLMVTLLVQFNCPYNEYIMIPIIMSETTNCMYVYVEQSTEYQYYRDIRITKIEFVVSLIKWTVELS